MLNALWLIMVFVAVVMGIHTGTMEEVSKASIDSAKTAVNLVIGLIGVMTFWLGAMKVLERAGFLTILARGLRPVLKWLFPNVPADHPANAMMVMNIASNMLGLGNAATPFGLKAMKELDTLNTKKGVATDEMALFLAINTSGLALLPTGMIAIRASLGSTQAGSILIPTFLATLCSTIVAILMAKFLSRLPVFNRDKYACVEVAESQDEQSVDVPNLDDLVDPNAHTDGKRLAVVIGIVVLACAYFLGRIYAPDMFAMTNTLGEKVYPWGDATLGWKQVSTYWLLPILILLIASVGWVRRIDVYSCLVDGGREGWDLAKKIVPYLVVILVAVGMLRASGAIAVLSSVLEPVTMLIGMPGEALPMALLRPLSGSGAMAISSEIMSAHGPDSFLGTIVSTMQGSTETTFYVLAVYFGAIGVTKARHTIFACLCADIVGVLASVYFVNLLFSNF